jgi:hypothetical protein
MAGKQKAQTNEAEKLFLEVQKRYPMYKEQADWTPTIFDDADQRNELADWLEERGLKRGDKDNRNDWLAPIRGLIIFKDSRVAVEAKLRFG